MRAALAESWIVGPEQDRYTDDEVVEYRNIARREWIGLVCDQLSDDEDEADRDLVKKQAANQLNGRDGSIGQLYGSWKLVKVIVEHDDIG